MKYWLLICAKIAMARAQARVRLGQMGLLPFAGLIMTLADLVSVIVWGVWGCACNYILILNGMSFAMLLLLNLASLLLSPFLIAGGYLVVNGTISQVPLVLLWAITGMASGSYLTLAYVLYAFLDGHLTLRALMLCVCFNLFVALFGWLGWLAAMGLVAAFWSARRVGLRAFFDKF